MAYQNSVSEKVGLRELKPDDTNRLSELANNKNIWNNLRDFFPFPYTKENARDFIDRCIKEDPKVTFAIEYKEELVGVAGLVLQSDINRLSAEVGYWIGEPYWNKGIASSAVALVVNYGFNTLKLNRIYCGVFDFNKASQRVLEKCGFTLEGIFKKAVIKDKKIIDEYRYAIIKE